MTPDDLDAILAGATDPAAATLARALREAWEEQEHLRGIVERASEQVHAVAAERDAAEQRAWAHAESRDATRAELYAMTRNRNEVNRERVVAHKALDDVAALLFVPLRDLGYDRAAEVLCAHVEELYQQRSAARIEEHALAAAEMRAARAEQERDAALAAVDAVRADYAPRREPPTADEVRALAGLWGDGIDTQWVACFDADTHVATVVFVGFDFAGDVACRSFVGSRLDAGAFATWEARGPTGPVAWSELARLVEGVRRG